MIGAIWAFFWSLHLLLKVAVIVGTVKLWQTVFTREKSLKGQCVLVTGGGSGIGRLMALRFAKAGARLVLWDLNEAGLQESATGVRDLGADCQTARVDVTDRVAVYAAIEAIEKSFGFVDILVNNAGIVSGKKFMDESDAFAAKTVEVNALAHVWSTKAVLRSMLERNHGHIVTIASAAGLVGVSGLASYCMSKFGAVGFAESLRLELRRSKSAVRTTCVCPFYIKTPLFAGARGVLPWVLDVLEPDYVADRIVTAVRRNEVLVCIPRIIGSLLVVKAILPTSLFESIGDLLGISKTMDDFAGTGEEFHARQAAGGAAAAAKK